MPSKKADPREGISLPDEKQVARKVRIRRIKRKLKAAVSIAIAAAAGTYMACDSGEKQKHQPAPNPTTPEISNLPAPKDAGADAAVDAATDASTALVKRDAGMDAKVDREEHRKGMPVRDNLLE